MSDLAALFALQAEDVRRCKICWSLFHKDDDEQHTEWHRKLVDVIVNACLEAAKPHPDPQETP